MGALAKLSYWVTFFDKNKISLKITQEEYDKLTTLLLNPETKLISIQGELHHASTISGVEKMIEKPKYAFTIGDVGYMSDADYRQKNNLAA